MEQTTIYDEEIASFYRMLDQHAGKVEGVCIGYSPNVPLPGPPEPSRQPRMVGFGRHLVICQLLGRALASVARELPDPSGQYSAFLRFLNLMPDVKRERHDPTTVIREEVVPTLELVSSLAGADDIGALVVLTQVRDHHPGLGLLGEPDLIVKTLFFCSTFSAGQDALKGRQMLRRAFAESWRKGHKLPRRRAPPWC